MEGQIQWGGKFPGFPLQIPPARPLVTRQRHHFKLAELRLSRYPSTERPSSLVDIAEENRQNVADTFRRVGAVKEIKLWNSKKRHDVCGVYHLAFLT